jgi:DNA-binding beta-propeller fold protein YncE
MHGTLKRCLGCGLGALALLIAATAMAAEVPKFEVDPFWPKPLPNNWALGQVAGVAVDERDHIWIIQRPNSLTRGEKLAAANPPIAKCCVPAPPIIEFDPEGNVVQAWGGPGQGYDWPKQEHGIRVDHQGFVWFGGNHKDDGFLLKFTRNGKFAMQIGKPGPRKGDQDTTQLGQPADVWVDAETNEAYVADGYGNHRIIVFDAATGAYKRHWGAYGKVPPEEKEIKSHEPGQPSGYDPKAPPFGMFRNPVHCVKLSKDGLVYVCDRVNDRMQVFRKDGTFVREWIFLKDTLGSGSVWDMYLWPDREQTYFINVDGANNEFRVVRRADGEVVGTYGRYGRNAGQFYGVHNVAIDSRGNVFTSEVFEGKRLQKWKVVSGAPQR